MPELTLTLHSVAGFNSHKMTMNLGPELTQSALFISHYSKHKDSCQNSFCDKISPFWPPVQLNNLNHEQQLSLIPPPAQAFAQEVIETCGFGGFFSMSIKKRPLL